MRNIIGNVVHTYILGALGDLAVGSKGLNRQEEEDAKREIKSDILSAAPLLRVRHPKTGDANGRDRREYQ